MYQPLLLSMMVAIGILLGFKMGGHSTSSMVQVIDSEGDYPLGRVEEVMRFIESRYMSDVDSDTLVNAAIAAIFQKLDPHSLYISKDEILGINENMEGKFKGIGIETLQYEDTVNIVNVLEGTPAQKAGLQSFDQIISINDSLVAGQGIPFEQIRNLLRGGHQDSHVMLSIKRQGIEKLLPIKVELDEIVVNSIGASFMVDSVTGLIKIDHFGENTYEEFMKEMEYLADSSGMKNLIIDVRDNPGGVLSQVTKILNQLNNTKDQLIVYTQGKNQKKVEYKSNGKVFFPMDKIAVLINENSASASEILAGAIQDWDRGAIIGRRSFGKGLVQEQYDLSNGGAIRLTTSRYYTPTGRMIQRDYTQRDAYIYEVYDRPDDGKLLPEDSLKIGEPLRTLRLGRPIYSNYGITPDVFVGHDIDKTNDQDLMIDRYLYEFMYQYCRSKGGMNGKNINLVNDSTILALNQYVSKKLGKDFAVSPSARVSLMDSMLTVYTSIMEGRKQGVRVSYQKDTYVDAALKYIYGSKDLDELL